MSQSDSGPFEAMSDSQDFHIVTSMDKMMSSLKREMTKETEERLTKKFKEKNPDFKKKGNKKNLTTV